MADSSNIFASPYDAKPQIWQTQGAKIYCSVDTPVTSSTGTGAVTCLTSLRAQLNRQVQDRYPLGGGGIIRLVGQPQGQLDISSLLGPQADVVAFLKKVSDICKPAYITVFPFALSKAVCGENSKLNTYWVFTNCTAMTTGLSIQQAQGGMSLVTVPISIRFDNIQVGGGGQ